MPKPIATAALLVAWLCANGALLDGLQVFAWTRMFANYTQSMSFTAALQETFNPAKPCELCIGVANAKENLQQKAVPAAIERAGDKELVLVLHTSASLVLTRGSDRWARSPAWSGGTRAEDVPVPPPRA